MGGFWKVVFGLECKGEGIECCSEGRQVCDDCVGGKLQARRVGGEVEV